MNRVSLMVVIVVVGLFAASMAQAQTLSPYRLGVGLGVPYGGVGLNAEMQGNNQLAPTIGVGSMLGAGLGWSLGAHYYLKPSEGDKHKGSRITLLFGTNALAEPNSSFSSLSDQKLMTGVSLGFGTQGKNWNFDLLFELSTSSAPNGYSQSTGAIDLSFGRMF